MLTSLTRLQRYYLLYSGGFLVFVGALAVLEQYGMPPRWIGYAFLFLTIVAVRRHRHHEPHHRRCRVLRRRSPRAGRVQRHGHRRRLDERRLLHRHGRHAVSHRLRGLAFIMGWTGGYCLVALLLAPYLRKFGQFTIPDFLGARYGGNAAALRRRPGRHPGLVRLRRGADLRRRPDHQPRLTGLDFEIGVFVGLAGILVCSFLGGMRAVTWTQVAQYIILIVAYMIPVVWLSVKQTGVPIPQAHLRRTSGQGDRAWKAAHSTRPQGAVEVRAIFKAQSDAMRRQARRTCRLAWPPNACCRAEKGGRAQGRQRAGGEVAGRREGAGRTCPPTSEAAKKALDGRQGWRRWARGPLAGMPRHAQQFAGDPNGDEEAKAAVDTSRRNFLAPGVLPDGGYRRVAAHPDALLHHARR